MKLTKKILSVVLAGMMAFGTCAVAFAADDTTTTETTAVAETEDNGTAATANAIKAGDTVTGNLSVSGDADWYTLTTTSAGLTRITFAYKSVGVTQSYYNVALYSSADTAKALYTFPVYGNADTTVSPDLYLDAGTYYVAVTEGNSRASYDYNLTVASVANPGTMETEPDDSTEKAVNLTLDTTGAVTAGMVYGTILGDDVDYYTFTSVKGYISFNLRNASKINGGKNGNFKITLFQVSNGMETNIATINLTETDTGNVQSAYIGIDAGTKYYVKVQGVNGSAGLYGIGIYGKESDGSESEYNDTKSVADVLAIGSNITGALNSESDVDCYKVVTTDTTSATITISKLTDEQVNGYWKVSIKNDGGSEVFCANVAAGQSASYTLTNDGAGSYYVYVSSGAPYTGADYTISAASVDVPKTDEPTSLWDSITGLDWGSWWNDNFAFLSKIDILSTVLTVLKLSIGTLWNYFTSDD